MQKMLHDNHSDEELQSRLVSKKREASRLTEANNIFLAQLEKAKYLRDCDKSTSFFHALIRRKVSRNHIVTVKKENRDRTTSQKQVVEEFLEYYKKLLGKNEVTEAINPLIVKRGKIINDNQAAQMIAPIADEEIKNVVFSIGDIKSLGSDGYNTCFFKKSWNIIGGKNLH
ncbi:uncharacterized protein LOC131148186 [Malania oleifera]|uniref:uncharacterized protein LOC131148186 n=1 Tax=Malania oleifera TaxID=397392 RepID=UPI0025AEA05F|nr:uncharacterized protein LOC131148186 [Malania oleifera]